MRKSSTGTELGNSHETVIAASRERCERQHNLVPDTSHPILRLQSSEVAPRFEDLIERTGGRQGIIRQLAEIAATAGQYLAVSDADGVLVRIEGDDSGRSEFEPYGIALGSCWDERVAGTNGVTIAMSHNKAFTVRGNEHFFAKLHPFACTAVPLLDAENQTVGAINLATVDRGNRAEYVFAQQLLGAAADKIQRLLFERQFQDAMVISISASGNHTALPNNELVAVDEAGNILGSTAGIHQIIGLAQPSELLGRSFESVFGADAMALHRIPERVLSTRYDTATRLDFSIQHSNVAVNSGQGWSPQDVSQKPNRSRRRLPPTFRELAIGSKTMSAVIERAQDHFVRAIPFIIEGESGTGKTALVEVLHGASKRPQSDILTIDCALLDSNAESRNHLEVVLARARAVNALDDDTVSDFATLVFDNVDEMPGWGQAQLRALLTTLEAFDDGLHEVRPASALRIVATSRKPLKDAVDLGRFRDDLYFLLANARLELPPLRAREQPATLAHALANRLAGATVELAAEAMDAINNYSWPGNVRELRSALRQALMDGDGRRISVLDLPREVATSSAGPEPSVRKGVDQSEPEGPYDEKARLLDALNSAQWNVTRAARKLGIGRATIHRKMKQHRIVRPAAADQDAKG